MFKNVVVLATTNFVDFLMVSRRGFLLMMIISIAYIKGNAVQRWGMALVQSRSPLTLLRNT
jgi:hypothetical protein